MIVKMKFLNISGPASELDRVTDTYLSRYEMQIENAATELKTTNNLRPFVEPNPYVEDLEKASEYAAMLDAKAKYHPEKQRDIGEIRELLAMLDERIESLVENEKELKERRAEIEKHEHAILPFAGIRVDVQKALHYKYMRVEFGRIAHESFVRLEKYLYKDTTALFVESSRDSEYIYGCYFVANADAAKAQATFKAMHFEHLDVPEEYIGTPDEAIESIRRQAEEAKQAIEKDEAEIRTLLHENAARILGAKERLEELVKNFDVRKLAARIVEGEEESFILCGWMGEDDAQKFMKETENDRDVMVIVEENRSRYFGDPPTKLKTLAIFKPFHMFIDMYGLPAHDELDPTVFVALTYTFIFGAMFGDVGQGACLFLFGGLLYLTKKINLAGIISIAGIFSTLFGFLYGSIFGFEDVLEPLWLRPAEAMTNLPFIGQLNTVFIVAVALGMLLNLLVMVFQMINAKKQGDAGNLLFSHNGLSGFFFYGMIIVTVVLYMTGHKTPGTILLAIFLGLPVLAFVFKEPLTQLLEHEKVELEGGPVMFFVQGFFELFEIMLSYFSNTLSYVRIGAFAVSHAAMMGVVLMLAGAEEGGSPSWAVVVLGNLFVCGMEGLVVGIQVLRLEYYELFSRFYKGTGRAFVPYKEIQK